jgi:hypothetical protein
VSEYQLAPAVAATEHDWTPPLADGAVAPPPTDVCVQLESVYNADVEPDADGDGFGDETQDLCAADPTRQTACVADLAVRGTATPRRPSASAERCATRSR